MRVLWFTNTPSLYEKNQTGYNGGGWISSLESAMRQRSDIELAVSFFHHEKVFKSVKNSTTYYPIPLYNSAVKKLKHNLQYRKYDRVETEYFLKVIEDFKPDIIHIFGSEKSFGLIVTHTQIPVVIHLQGLLRPYLNAWFPPGVSVLDYYRFYSFKALLKELKNYRFFSTNASREEIILRSCRHFMGRTKWDQSIAKLYAPSANYYYCSEILREAFYSAAPWQDVQHEQQEHYTLLTTISAVNYKGIDLLLKTACLLKQLTDLNFVWNVYGISECPFWEKKLRITASAVNIDLKGVTDTSTLIKAMYDSQLYVHPSYIDNSPNSVCEAQMIGIPVICTNVGGIPSLVKDELTGVLVPANDPYALCSEILKLSKDQKKAFRLGKNGRQAALCRHHKGLIVETNVNIYKSILLTQKNDI